MAEVVRDLFQGPPGVPRPMGKVMAKIMKGHIADECPLVRGRLLFEGAPPLMNPIFGQVGAPLGRKDIGAAFIPSPVLEIQMERAPHLIEQVNLSEFLSLVAYAQPSEFRANMGVRQQQ